MQRLQLGKASKFSYTRTQEVAAVGVREQQEKLTFVFVFQLNYVFDTLSLDKVRDLILKSVLLVS